MRAGVCRTIGGWRSRLLRLKARQEPFGSAGGLMLMGLITGCSVFAEMCAYQTHVSVVFSCVQPCVCGEGDRAGEGGEEREGRSLYVLYIPWLNC